MLPAIFPGHTVNFRDHLRPVNVLRLCDQAPVVLSLALLELGYTQCKSPAGHAWNKENDTLSLYSTMPLFYLLECFYDVLGFETSAVYIPLYIRVASCFMNMRIGPDYI